jgi:hypothetical protein
MTPPLVDHVLLTRFNLPTKGVEGLIRAREGWLQDRVALFERYCAASVARQSVPVTWLVYFDPESPTWLLDRLRPLVATGLFRPVLRASVGPAELSEDIAAAVVSPADLLLTTNLDNDDGIAVDFVERLQAVRTRHRCAAVYLTHGLIRSSDQLFLRTDRRNAFCSLLEPWEDARTCWAEYHNELGRTRPVVEVDGPAGWLQVVHGANVSNRVRGRLVSPRPHRHRFGDLLDDLPEPRPADVVRDALLRLPVRSSRDLGRAAVRTAGLRVLGKDRYQELKLRASATITRARR